MPLSHCHSQPWQREGYRHEFSSLLSSPMPVEVPHCTTLLIRALLGAGVLRRCRAPRQAPPPHAQTASDQPGPGIPPTAPICGTLAGMGRTLVTLQRAQLQLAPPFSLPSLENNSRRQGKTRLGSSLWMTSTHGRQHCPPLVVAQLPRVTLLAVYCFVPTPWMTPFGKSLALSQPRESQNTTVCTHKTSSVVFLQLQKRPSSLAWQDS